ncbi:MAG: ABC-2 transporter permease [Clostridiales bacterium]|nr:ABC-2 transporter permease [Clostridiales bacterium]
MKGLLMKDLFNLKRQGGIILLVLVMYGLFSFSTGMSEVLGGLVAVFGAMLPVTALAYDERAKWDKYALSMPVTRRQIVLSKYLLGFLLTAAAFVLNVVLQAVGKSENPWDIFLVPLCLAGVGLLFLSLLMPLLFKFGTEKARLLMLVLVAVPVAGAMLLSNNNIPLPDESVQTALLLLIPAGVLAISIVLSIRIYEKKEL